MASIWSSVEAHCWAKDLMYEDYLATHAKLKIKGSPLSKKAYQAVCAGLDIDMQSRHNPDNKSKQTLYNIW